MAVRRRPAQGAPGQHFLRSSRLAAELVRDAGVSPGHLAVDIGAGTGVLTQALAAAGARVVALEVDPGLASGLRSRFHRQEVAVVEADACHWSWPREPFSVVSNLPFAGSGAILAGLLRDPTSGLCQADVIVQWEFAQKHSAVWPATLRSTYWRAWFEIGIVARLSRSAFAPPPSVDAAVLRIARRSCPLVPLSDQGAYRRFLDEGFASRVRLTRGLRRLLTPRQVRRAATVGGFDPNAFARDLDARQWAQLFACAQGRSERS